MNQVKRINPTESYCVPIPADVLSDFAFKRGVDWVLAYAPAVWCRCNDVTPPVVIETGLFPGAPVILWFRNADEVERFERAHWLLLD
ncbi:hypothetical protein ACFODL_15625 [Phenylobacterium terrae]|uniref:Uncharacterized protein n=1 Tax=Phenylobacterium terrae TaxID=2665495 RepID=A0ABW4N7G4_9CAUL